MTRNEFDQLLASYGVGFVSDAMWRIAQIAAAYEREQCAKLVEPSPDHLQNPWHYLGGDEGIELLLELAQNIRERGNP